MSKFADFKLKATDISTFGTGLHRPECVWIDADGIWVSDERGGVALVTADKPAQLLGSGIKETNGYSRRANGTFVAAGLGDGAVHEIAPDGKTSVLLDQIDGKPLGTVNHAWVDGERVWVSLMTRSANWGADIKAATGDGYIVLIENGRARIVADGLYLTNEVKVSPDGRHLYAAESLGCRIVRFAIAANGGLGPKELVCDLGYGGFPDGFTFDDEGNIWVTLVLRNGLSVFTPDDGVLHTLYEDVQTAALDAFIKGLADNSSKGDMLGLCASPTGPIVLPTSLEFGGPGRKTVYVGSLATPHLITFQAP